MSAPPVLVLSGHTTGLAVVRALGCQGIEVSVLRYDRHDMAHVSRFVREVLLCPNPERDEAGFVEMMGSIRDRYAGALVMPTGDDALGALSLLKPALENLDYVVACPDRSVVETFLEKSRTAELADSSGVAVPFTVVLDSAEDIDRYASVARFPGVLKPLVGHRFAAVFGRKWTRVDDAASALRSYAEARAAGFEVLLQEYIPGDESLEGNYFAYRASDEAQVEFTAVKIRNFPSDTGSPCVTRSKHIPELIEPGRRILASAGYVGFACAEFKRDLRDGIFKLIEVNARHNLSGAHALRCGINFPWLQYRHLIHGELPMANAFPDDVYWIDISRDLRAMRSYLRRPEYSMRRFLEPYLAPHASAVLSLRDPRPALVRAANQVGVMIGVR